ncbi:MAG: RecX family transcriptional regulator [Acidobacteria bacterium]|nr:RecX family transcriptional regulator [Acidobacteriota bacterium]MCG3191201.1 Regulatory protein RecX [Thermoanaerobaculia bacterium]
MRLLSRQDRSAEELRKRLLEKGFAAEHAAEALRFVLETGLLSERRFVESAVASGRRRGKGPRLIQAALRAKGADEEVVTQVLSEDDPAQKSERILAQIRKKERTFPAGLTARERSKKLFDYLVRRGFEPEAVIAALRQKGDSIDDDSP